MSNHYFYFLLPVVFVFFTLVLTGQTVTFKVDMTAVDNPKK